ncbi:hypothetical protein CLU79DRAFT_729173 [Phycomyces nitens]|nr:hypothetical protein CLU79DRAFT_729173 [Phycomyces nitens]
MSKTTAATSNTDTPQYTLSSLAHSHSGCYMDNEDIFSSYTDDLSNTGLLPFSLTSSSLSYLSITPSPPPLDNIYSASRPPTIEECREWITEHCHQLAEALTPTTPTRSQQDISTLLHSVRILLDAMDPTDPTPKQELQKVQSRFDTLKTIAEPDSGTLREMILAIQDICQTPYQPISFVTIRGDTLLSFTLESPHIIANPLTAHHYTTLWPDQIDPKATWFRQHFIGKPYLTLIGPMSSNQSQQPQQRKKSINSVPDETYGIISIVREMAKEFAGLGNKSASILGAQFRIILRGGKTFTTSQHIVHETLAKDTQTHLEATGVGHTLDSANTDQKKSRSLRNLSSSPNSSGILNSTLQANRLMRAAILSVCPDLDLRLFKELSAESTSTMKLEDDLLRFDEIGIPKRYKFGVLNVCDGQTTEEEWFSNTGLSEPLEEFLDLLGTRVALLEYDGYTAGLDIKTGESGETSYVSRWREHDIMFHVAPLMPLRKNDKQQVHRKRYIGNDVACVVFVEGNQAFDPTSIRSQFLHIFVLVHPEIAFGKPCWRVQVIRKHNVVEFGPLLPSPPLFFDKEELAGFITLKLINGENAALKSEKFAVPNTKARTGILKTLVDSGISSPTHVSHTLSSHLGRTPKDDSVFLAKYAQRNSHETYERPKPPHIERSLTMVPSDSSNLWKLQMVERTFSGRVSPTPPQPSPSRSSLFQELKSLGKRRNGLQKETNLPTTESSPVTKKESQPKSVPRHSKSSLTEGVDKKAAVNAKEPTGHELRPRQASRRATSQSTPPKTVLQSQPNIISTILSRTPPNQSQNAQAKSHHEVNIVSNVIEHPPARQSRPVSLTETLVSASFYSNIRK